MLAKAANASKLAKRLTEGRRNALWACEWEVSPSVSEQVGENDTSSETGSWVLWLLSVKLETLTHPRGKGPEWFQFNYI